MKSVASLLVVFVAACSSSSSMGDHVDGGTGGTNDGGDDEPDISDESCSAGARACFGASVGVCNSTGTAWLFEMSCLDTCSAGACTGACVAGSKRCNTNAVETCDASGASWSTTESCAHGCESNQCVLDQLNITTDTTLDGLVIVRGPVNVFSGATLRAPSGELTIRATSITVDDGGAIEVAAANHSGPGGGSPADRCYSQGYISQGSGGGGGHATGGDHGRTQGSSCGGVGGSTFGSELDVSVEPGGPGGPGFLQTTTAAGGGMMRLYAPAVTVAGTLRADGDGGGLGPGGDPYSGGGSGAGGAILVATDTLSVTGTISAYGYGGGYGGGGDGYVKLVYGAAPTLTGTFRGLRSTSVAPPTVIRSLTHPDSDLFYNDDFSSAAIAWAAPFVARQGYYWRVDAAEIAPPTPGTGALSTTELISIARDQLVDGDNFVHLVSVDATTQIGTVESSFRVRINSEPPALTSATHASQTAWSSSHDPLIAWTFPHGDASYKGVYYVLDHDGSTIPDSSATFVPVTQKQILRAGLASGIWVLHVISVDRANRRTRAAAHYQIRIGDDPGTGRVLGHVNGPSGPIANATVTFNRGVLADQHTNSGGIYDLTTVPAGTWEVTASAPGFTSQTTMVTVPAAGQMTIDFALAP